VEEERRFSQFLAIPYLCAHAKCRRARSCRGDPHACVIHYLPIVPHVAVALALALPEARRCAVPFEQALRDLEPEIRAHQAWCDILRLPPGSMAPLSEQVWRALCDPCEETGADECREREAGGA
jgi:hypothetical protein